MVLYPWPTKPILALFTLKHDFGALVDKMEPELVDVTTAELWLNAFDAATALEPLVDPALVDMLAPHHPTFESHGAEIRWLRAEKFFL